MKNSLCPVSLGIFQPVFVLTCFKAFFFFNFCYYLSRLHSRRLLHGTRPLTRLFFSFFFCFFLPSLSINSAFFCFLTYTSHLTSLTAIWVLVTVSPGAERVRFCGRVQTDGDPAVQYDISSQRPQSPGIPHRQHSSLQNHH